MAKAKKHLHSKLSRLRRLGEILVEERLITGEQLETAEEIQKSSGGHLASILLSQRYLTEYQLSQCLVSQLQLPFIVPSQYDISANVQRVLPTPFLHQHNLIPLDLFGRQLVLATAGNVTEDLVDEIEEATCLDLAMFVALATDIRNTLQAKFPLEKVSNEVSEKFDQLFQEVDASDSPETSSPGPTGSSAAEPAAPPEPTTDEWRPES